MKSSALAHYRGADRGARGLEWLSLSYFLYSVALALGLLLSLPFWLFQIARHGKYWRSFPQRMGKVPHALTAISGERLIWIHAVSVGEVLAVAGLIAQIRQAFPQHRMVISSTTDTGHTLAQKRFGAENSFYFPLDFAFAIRPYLRALRPELVVLAETEFWPNFMRLAHASGARIAVVNARISDRSWPNYRRFTWALRKILRNVDLLLAQTQQVAVTALSACGVAMAVCTNKPTAFSRKILEFLNLASFFCAIVGPDVAGARKPQAKHVLRTLEATECTPAQALFVGDMPIDVEAAHNSGIDAAVVATGSSSSSALKAAHPDHYLDRLADLVEIVRNGASA